MDGGVWWGGAAHLVWTMRSSTDESTLMFPLVLVVRFLSLSLSLAVVLIVVLILILVLVMILLISMILILMMLLLLMRRSLLIHIMFARLPQRRVIRRIPSLACGVGVGGLLSRGVLILLLLLAGVAVTLLLLAGVSTLLLLLWVRLVIVPRAAKGLGEEADDADDEGCHVCARERGGAAPAR